MKLGRLLLVLVPLVAYASALRSGFVWDDHRVIEHGRLIGSLAHVPSLFTHDTMFNSDGGAFQARANVDTYRPLTMTTLFLDHALYGQRAAGYHATSVLAHLLGVLLLFAVGRRLGASEPAALLGALLFGVHPATVEAVHWVNGRSDPLCVAFFLLAVWLWLDGRPRALAGAALAFFAATLCKETAFLLAPAALVLWRKRRATQPPVVAAQPVVAARSLVIAAWPFALGGALGLALRLLALHRPAVSAGAGHLRWALARLPLLWLDGLRSLILPVAQQPESLFERYRAPTLAWQLGAIVVSLALALAAAQAFRRGRVLLPWFAASFFLALAPIALLTAPSADAGWFGWGRYLYPAAPMLGLCAGVWLLDVALPRLRPPLQRLVRAAAGLVILAGAAQTFAAGRDYRDDRAFAAALLADHPESSVGWSELAVVELRDGHAQRAAELALRACALAPTQARHFSRAANALMALGQRAEAYRAAARALALDPRDANGRYVTAIARLEQHREAEAAELLLGAIAEEPEQEGPWRTLSQAASHLGPGSAFVSAARALLAQPAFAAIAPRAGALVGE